MKHSISLAAFALLLTTSPVAAQFEVADQLGHLLASEQACALAFDHDAIGAYIDEHVDAADMDFTSNLAMRVRIFTRQVEEMNPSTLAAQCRQAERVARSFNFID